MCVKSLLLLAPLLAACAQPTTPPEQYEYTLAPATQWSGAASRSAPASSAAGPAFLR